MIAIQQTRAQEPGSQNEVGKCLLAVMTQQRHDTGNKGQYRRGRFQDGVKIYSPNPGEASQGYPDGEQANTKRGIAKALSSRRISKLIPHQLAYRLRQDK